MDGEWAISVCAAPMGKWSRSFQSESHSLLFAIKQTSIHKISWDTWTVFGNNFFKNIQKEAISLVWGCMVWPAQIKDSWALRSLLRFSVASSPFSLQRPFVRDFSLQCQIYWHRSGWLGLLLWNTKSHIRNSLQLEPFDLKSIFGRIKFKSIKVSKTSHQWSDSQIQTPGGWRMIPAPKYQKVKIPLKIIFDLNLLHELVLAL